MSPEEELPPDLKSLEALLGSLRPRADRLDRERLMFLAGQASVVTSDSRRAARARASGVGRWGWPSACAAMTATAAALLVALFSRPGPQIVERIIRVPAEQIAKDNDRPQRAPGDLVDEPAADQPRNVSDAPRPASPWEAIGALLLQDLAASRVSSPPPYPRRLQQVLAHGLDTWERPTPVQDGERTSAPVSYRQLLDSLLDDHSDKPLPGPSPKTSFSG